MQKRMLFKLLVLGGISVLFLIALASIDGITQERKQRLLEVQKNIAESYAGPQRIIGPFVLLECRETWTGKLYNKEKDLWYEKEQSAQRRIQLYPEVLTYEGSLAVQERYRGIFKANVFQNEGHFSGSIRFPELDSLRKESTSQIELLSARVCLLVSDPRGISETPELTWNDTTLPIHPGSAFREHRAGVHAELSVTNVVMEQTADFSLHLNLHGMERLEVVPVGANNQIRLSSTWPHPSFIGDFLATDRAVSDSGFHAEWSVNELACSAQQSIDAGQLSKVQHLGVNLIDPINPYSLTDRALKYGFLFIFITFASFFLFELIRQLKIHPIQYGFVGLAQAIFFLLLLSLSEHLGFGGAYLVAALATLSAISFYLCGILRGIGRGLLFGAILAVLYGVLYGLLQSEDHALVAGAMLLFALLTLVMVLTRKIDWYALGDKTKPEVAPKP